MEIVNIKKMVNIGDAEIKTKYVDILLFEVNKMETDSPQLQHVPQEILSF